MAKDKQKASPFYELGSGVIVSPQGFASDAGFGTPPKPSRRGEPKEPGTGQIPTGSSKPDGGASSAIKAIFGRAEGKRK